MSIQKARKRYNQKAMEQTLNNIKKVSLLFFIVTGALHLGSSLMIANYLYLKQAFIINKTMDVPLVLTGMLYGLSSLRLTLTEPHKKHKILDITLLSVIAVTLIALIIINLIMPNLYE
jgi:hypothetical protein